MLKVLIIAVLAFTTFGAIVREEVWNKASLKNGKTDILLYMTKQTDFKTLSLKGTNVNKIACEDTRGFFIMNHLKEQATTTQKNVIQFLKANNLKYTSFWVKNAIQVDNAPISAIKQLERFHEIKYINSNEEFHVELEKPHPFKPKTINKSEIEFNVRWINADKVWDQGYKGKGIVTGAIDTGVISSHPALVGAYRGTDSKSGKQSHDFNWYDADQKVRTPVDSNGHGTHCTGTVCGGRDRQIGVAPEAKFIHCRAISGASTPAKYLTCYQFFMAPHDLNGNNADPSLRPHTTSHSYGCGGCRPDDLKEAFEAMKAAGIFLSVSAGNSGSRCSSVGRSPGHYASAFTVGALNKESRTIARFSSRGPITYDRSNRLSPQISAPGVSVVSSHGRSGYRALSGTSMSAPAVSGAVALLWDAVPSLKRKIDETIDILQKTARGQTSNECSSSGSPNNVYGYGGIDILAAVEEAKSIYQVKSK